ncbi:MAG: T9SS type A sorting domain-containing protein [Bacteroidota bacterium]
MKRTTFLAVMFFLFCFNTSGQILNEQRFPPLPYKGTSATVHSVGSKFYLSGVSSEYWSWPPPIDYWGWIYQPYFILSPHKVFPILTFLPDRAQTISWGLGGNGNRIDYSSALTSRDSLFVVWSNVKEYYGDVPPNIVYDTSFAALAKFDGDSLRTVLTIAGGMRPSLSVDNNDTLHIAWEYITPMEYSWGEHYSSYSSSIFYSNRSVDGKNSTPIEIEKGFFPSVKTTNSSVYLLYFRADSSNQRTFTLRLRKRTDGEFSQFVNLHTFTYGNISYFDLIHYVPFMYLQWNIDSAGNVHAVWRDHSDLMKKYILHYSDIGGTQIDSVNDAYAYIHFKNNGDVKIFSAVPIEGTDSLQLQTYISRQGSSLQKIHSSTFRVTGSINQVLADKHGNDHILFSSGRNSYLVKFASTDSAQLMYLSSEYIINPGSHVDSANRVWLTGQRDSTTVLLNFSLDEVGTHQDFVFPLRIGNEWHYGVYGDPFQPWPDYADIQKILSDTLMPNGERYFVISAQHHPARYLRKDGLQVFQYNPADSTEHLRYDFSRTEGDTIAKQATQTIVLSSIRQMDLFGRKFRSFLFEGSFVDHFDWQVEIADSIGIVSNGAIAPRWVLMGAKVNGKTYGKPLSVEQDVPQLPESFSLSQNYPNPFNPATTIQYSVGTDAHPSNNNVRGGVSAPIITTLKIYDVLGREVATLVNEEKSAGVYKVTWNASHFSSGVYFVRMTAGRFSSVKKLLLTK